MQGEYKLDNNTSAYDLSAFEKRKSHELKVIKNEKHPKESILARSGVFFLVAFLLIIVASTLYNNAIINELGNQIVELNQEYAELVGENKKMTAVLESKVSLKNVEEYAKENLGLAQMEQYQIEYINLLPNDKIISIKAILKENLVQNVEKNINLPKVYYFCYEIIF